MHEAEPLVTCRRPRTSKRNWRHAAREPRFGGKVNIKELLTETEHCTGLGSSRLLQGKQRLVVPLSFERMQAASPCLGRQPNARTIEWQCSASLRSLVNETDDRAMPRRHLRGRTPCLPQSSAAAVGFRRNVRRQLRQLSPHAFSLMSPAAHFIESGMMAAKRASRPVGDAKVTPQT